MAQGGRDKRHIDDVEPRLRREVDLLRKRGVSYEEQCGEGAGDRHCVSRSAADESLQFVDRVDLLRLGQLGKLAQPTITATGKRIPGLKLDNPRQLALMHALVRFTHIAAANSFATAELYPRVLAALGSGADRYTLASLAPQATLTARTFVPVTDFATNRWILYAQSLNRQVRNNITKH